MNYTALARQEAVRLIGAAAGSMTARPLAPPQLEETKASRHGDWASAFAMQNAEALGMNPRQLARRIIEAMDLEGSCFQSAQVAGPGFINLRLRPQWFEQVVRCIGEAGERYGTTSLPEPEQVMVVFASADPAGPPDMDSARGSALGDSLAEALHRAGHTVWRERYISDAGDQIEQPGRSLPTGHGPRVNLPAMERDLLRYGIRYDSWFLGSALYASGEVEETARALIASGQAYEADGALWLRATGPGCERDQMLRRSNGRYTCFTVDIAYHRSRLVKGGLDRVISIWGADRHGHVKGLQKALDALGLDGSGRLEVVLTQRVRPMQNGKAASVGGHTGKAITLTELPEAIPADAVRFFLNARQRGSLLEPDLDLAVRRDGENPVYYVQYAHARIRSIMRALREGGVDTDIAAPRLGLLTHGSERELIRQLARLPEEIHLAAEGREPARLNRYATGVATAFRRFYHDCPIRHAGSDALRDARIYLAQCTGTVIRNTLSCFGVSAPDTM